jgi:modulator of FtsH protease
MGYPSNEPMNKDFAAAQAESVRAMFIGKVYGMFLVALLLAIGGGWLGSQPDMAPALRNLGFGALLIELGLLVGAIVCRGVPGLNVAMLYGFTFTSGLFFGPFVAAVSNVPQLNGIIGQALMMTSTIFVGLTGYVFITRKDFSFLGGFLMVSLLVLIGVGIAAIFFPQLRGNTMGLLISAAGAFIFGLYILYDTSEIIHRYPPDMATMAVLDLFLDFANLFIYLVRFLIILAVSKDD